MAGESSRHLTLPQEARNRDSCATTMHCCSDTSKLPCDKATSSCTTLLRNGAAERHEIRDSCLQTIVRTRSAIQYSIIRDYSGHVRNRARESQSRLVDSSSASSSKRCCISDRCSPPARRSPSELESSRMKYMQVTALYLEYCILWAPGATGLHTDAMYIAVELTASSNVNFDANHQR